MRGYAGKERLGEGQNNKPSAARVCRGGNGEKETRVSSTAGLGSGRRDPLGGGSGGAEAMNLRRGMERERLGASFVGP